MTTTPEYDAILARKLAEREAKMGHTHKQMTESETAKEVAKTTEGLFLIPPRKRGRPKGSRNKPKTTS